MREGRTDPETADDSVVVPSLGRWGLSPHADLVYRTLTLLGPRGRAHLSRELGVQPSRVDGGIDELLAIGAVRPHSAGRERRWVALAPSRVLSLMRTRQAPPPVAARYRRHLATVAGLHLERLPSSAVRRLPDRQSARRRIADLVATERREHLAINTEDVFSADAPRVAQPLDRSLLAQGIRLRTLGLPSQLDGRHDAPPGMERREVSWLPLKLMVFDRRTALFPADPANFEAGAIEVDDPDAVAQLTLLFYAVWGKANDPRRQEVPAIVLTHREQAIVALLAAGLSEEAAAAELGMSRRTVVYTMRALMDRLGVKNRFQLALILGAARAVPMPPHNPDPEETP